MGRSPCCDKVGLKKGPWTPEEDHVLISFIIQHGHSNWRALPKQAGLLRCGKSCRLRWINYLKPDIKRGNFSKEEEDTIIQLHEMMGNRWSAIAARLPGRTDNEIKNVWHTHLKKRLNKQNQIPKSQGKVTNKQHCDNNINNCNNNNININVTTSNYSTSENNYNYDYDYNYDLYEIGDGKCKEAQNYSQQSNSSDDFSSITEVSSVQVPNSTANATDAQKYDVKKYELDELPIVDAAFWPSHEFSYDDFGMNFEISNIIEDEKMFGENNIFSSMGNNGQVIQEGGADFWFDLFASGGAPELPEF